MSHLFAGRIHLTSIVPHYVPSVVAELHNADTSLDIPEHAGHISRTGDNLAVIEESAAAEITRMSAQFASTLDVASIFAVQVVNGTDIVETTTGDKVSGGGIGTGHNPTRSQGDGVDFVCCVGIPDDELAVLRSRDEVPTVIRPVHGVGFGQMAPECPSWAHHNPRKRVDLSGHGADFWGEEDQDWG